MIARYTYDSLGNTISITDANGNNISSTSHIANINPIRYRGYYLDKETGFYYLGSRYYDPDVSRFISKDDVGVVSLDSSSLYDKNLYSYCNNSPIIYEDTNGYLPDLALDIAFIIGDIASLVANPKNVLGYAELAGDFVGLLLPGITGGGKIVRTVINSDKLKDAVKLVDKVIDSSKAINSTIETGKEMHI